MLPHGSCNRPFGALESVTRDGCEASGGRGIGGTAATTSLPEPEHHACRQAALLRYYPKTKTKSQTEAQSDKPIPSTPTSTQPGSFLPSFPPSPPPFLLPIRRAGMKSIAAQPRNDAVPQV
ncbi:hypothetical protein KC19_4G126400 [Ceratodon purpureus]|uniref:Uncharacterized protein n=1 Tax=Ceratodon purpureus TaxID=3225 RepID=A0A8T0IA10_CERPU|nr:hypothetical protein KC19_4G126400 [Ceratodon purpureus]